MSLDPQHLAALAAILRCGTFELAARELNVTQSAVSQRIKALEDRLGVALVRRGQPCTGTDAGVRLARHAEDIGLLEARALRDILPDTATGAARVRIAVNADSLATWFMAALTDTRDLMYDLVIDDQDHSADWLRRGEVNAAVTSHARPVTGCDSHALGGLEYTATASPDFMNRWFPDGVTQQAMASAPVLVFNAKDRLQANWMHQMTGQKLAPPSHFLPTSHGFVEATLGGLGWSMNPTSMVWTHLAEGRLIALDPGRPLITPLFWQISRMTAPALAPLSRNVIAQAKRRLTQ